MIGRQKYAFFPVSDIEGKKIKTRQQRDSNSRGIASNWFLINRLNHSAMLPCGVRQASHASYFAPIYHFLLRKKKKMNAPAGNQTRVSSVAGTYTITVLPALILMSAQLVSTQSDNFVILQDSQCRNVMSAEAMAQWQRVGFQTQRLGVRIGKIFVTI